MVAVGAVIWFPNCAVAIVTSVEMGSCGSKQQQSQQGGRKERRKGEERGPAGAPAACVASV